MLKGRIHGLEASLCSIETTSEESDEEAAKLFTVGKLGTSITDGLEQEIVFPIEQSLDEQPSEPAQFLPLLRHKHQRRKAHP